MKLYLVRHGIAEERHSFSLTGKNDEHRPLTEKGTEKIQFVCEAFKKIEPDLDLILQSPLTRSIQTARIFKSQFPNAQLRETPHLSPGHAASSLIDVINNSSQCSSIMLVGHEPDLGHFLSWLLLQQACNRFPFKKGSIAKVDYYKDKPCKLKWFIHPKLLLELK